MISNLQNIYDHTNLDVSAVRAIVDNNTTDMATRADELEEYASAVKDRVEEIRTAMEKYDEIVEQVTALQQLIENIDYESESVIEEASSIEIDA